MKPKLTLIFLLISNFFFSQTIQEIMKSDLEKMKFHFLNKNYKIFSTFVYPKVVELYGSEEQMIESAKLNVEKLEEDDFRFVNIYFKNFNENFNIGKEIQTSFTQVITMETPEGRISEENTMIAISSDKGKSWKFIDTSNYDEILLQKNFPNLSKKLILKPKIRNAVNELQLKEKCLEFRNLELQNLSALKFTKSKIIITETDQREIAEDGSFITSKLIRNPENPCKIDFVIKEIYDKPKSSFKIGDILHLELTGFENDELFFIATLNKKKLIISDKYKIVKKLL